MEDGIAETDVAIKKLARLARMRRHEQVDGMSEDRMVELEIVAVGHGILEREKRKLALQKRQEGGQEDEEVESTGTMSTAEMLGQNVREPNARRYSHSRRLQPQRNLRGHFYAPAPAGMNPINPLMMHPLPPRPPVSMKRTRSPSPLLRKSQNQNQTLADMVDSSSSSESSWESSTDVASPSSSSATIRAGSSSPRTHDQHHGKRICFRPV